MIFRTALMSGIFAVAGATIPQTASADIMETCTAVIEQRCSDVRKGRGRMVACLAANNDQVEGDCKADVDREMSKRIVRMSVPIGSTPISGTAYGDEMTASCQAEMRSLCSGVRQEVEPMLACFYARGNRVSKTCQDTADKLIKDLM